MRIIKCDFCKKEIGWKESKIGIYYLNSKSYYLWNKCFKKFEKISKKYFKKNTEFNKKQIKEQFNNNEKLANDFQKEIEELTKGEK